VTHRLSDLRGFVGFLKPFYFSGEISPGNLKSAVTDENSRKNRFILFFEVFFRTIRTSLSEKEKLFLTENFETDGKWREKW
jgi:hypothetical protein